MQTKINIYQSDSQIVRDAIDKVIVQVYRKKRDCGHKSFLLTGCSAGCGTTYTAINMAVALANAGWKTVLVDCDIRKGMEYKRLNQDIKTGLSDYLTGKVTDTVYGTNNEKLDYIPCGSNGESPVRLLATREMEMLDGELKEKYDFVIYDFPSVNIVPDAGIMIPVVDDVILVVGVNETTKDQLASAKAKVKETEGKYMGVIANKLELPEYKHYVKDYDYFKSDKLKEKHDRRMKRLTDSETTTEKQSAEKQSTDKENTENQSTDKNTNNSSRNRRKMMLMCMLILGISFVTSNTAYATGEANPRLLVETYSISDDEIVPGEEFELTMKIRNTSIYYDTYSVVVTVEDNSSAGNTNPNIYPVYGSSNQTYIERVYARNSWDITVPLKAAENINMAEIPLKVTITYNDNYFVEKQTNVAFINLPVRLSGDLNLVSASVPESASVGTKARISATYENTGSKNLYNITMKVSGGEAFEPITANLYNIGGGEKNTAEVYIDCKEVGKIPIAISFAYEDDQGEVFETEESLYNISVTESSATDLNGAEVTVIGGGVSGITFVLLAAIVIIAILILFILRKRRR